MQRCEIAAAGQRAAEEEARVLRHDGERLAADVARVSAELESARLVAAGDLAQAQEVRCLLRRCLCAGHCVAVGRAGPGNGVGQGASTSGLLLCQPQHTLLPCLQAIEEGERCKKALKREVEQVRCLHGRPPAALPLVPGQTYRPLCRQVDSGCVGCGLALWLAAPL